MFCTIMKRKSHIRVWILSLAVICMYRYINVQRLSNHGLKSTLHIPVTAVSVPFPLAIVFKPRPGELGVLYILPGYAPDKDMLPIGDSLGEMFA